MMLNSPRNLIKVQDADKLYAMQGVPTYLQKWATYESVEFCIFAQCALESSGRYSMRRLSCF